MNFNLFWKVAPSGLNTIKRVIQINVVESGVINPGAYSVETRGNVIYWPLRGERK